MISSHTILSTVIHASSPEILSLVISVLVICDRIQGKGPLHTNIISVRSTMSDELLEMYTPYVGFVVYVCVKVCAAPRSQHHVKVHSLRFLLQSASLN